MILVDTVYTIGYSTADAAIYTALQSQADSKNIILELASTVKRAKGVFCIYTVDVTSNLNFSAGLPRRESANGGRLLISAHALRIGRVASAAREIFRAEVGTIYTLVATRHL